MGVAVQLVIGIIVIKSIIYVLGAKEMRIHDAYNIAGMRLDELRPLN